MMCYNLLINKLVISFVLFLHRLKDVYFSSSKPLIVTYDQLVMCYISLYLSSFITLLDFTHPMTI